MSSIDRRVVEMRFNNRQFQQGVKETQSSLEELQRSLKLDGATQGLNKVQEAAKLFSLHGIEDSVTGVADKFNWLGAVGFTVIQDLTRSAIDLGKKMGRALTDPILEGGKKRALNMEQARFQFKGLGIDVEAAMEAALYGVKDTAYGLDEAAMAAAQFAASNVPMENMGDSLRAISGVAAMTNSSYTDMANVFTKVAGQGRVMGDDLLRLSARGLNAAAAMGESMGYTEAEIRDMVTKGEISFEDFATAMDEAFGEHATKASETFTGALSLITAALARMGASFYTPGLEKFRQVFLEIPRLVDEVHDGIKPLISLFEELLEVNGDKLIGWLSEIDLSRLEYTIRPFVIALSRVFDILGAIVSSFAGAFKDVFPPADAETIKSIGRTLVDFFDTIKEGITSTDGLQRTFRGVISIFGIAWEVVKGLGVMFGELFGFSAKGLSGILDFTGGIGDLIYNILEAIRSGDGFLDFFRGVGRVLRAPLDILTAIGGALVGMFSDVELPDLDFFDIMAAGLEAVGNFGNFAKDAFSGFLDFIRPVLEFLAPLGQMIKDAFSTLGEALSGVFSGLDLDSVLNILNTGIFAALAVGIGKVAKAFSGGFESGGFLDFIKGLLGLGDGGGIVDSIKDLLEGAGSALQDFQNSLKAKTLITIAGAIALLAASLLVLSLIDAGAMTTALTGMAVMFGQLMGAMVVFEKIATGPGIAKLPILAAALILLSIAINLMAVAVSALSRLSWGEMIQGLVGLMAILGALAGVSHLLKGSGPGLFMTAAALVVLGVAVNILAGAVRKMSELTWGEMAQGLVGVAGALLILVGATKGLKGAGPGLIITATALVILGAALNLIASAVESFAAIKFTSMVKGLIGMAGALVLIAGSMRLMPNPVSMMASSVGLLILGSALETIAGVIDTLSSLSWGAMVQGLVGLAGALVVIAGAMWIMPPNMLLTAVSMVVLSEALVTLSEALTTMGEMSWGEIGKSLVVLAGSLVILAGAMYLMTGALPGALALIVIAGALSILTPVLIAMGNMSWEQIGMGLLVLASSLLVIAAAGYVLTPVVLTLTLFGAALALIGVAVFLAGTGILFLAMAMTALAAAGVAGMTALQDVLLMVIGLIPAMAVAIGEGFIAIIEVLTESMSSIGDFLVALFSTILDSINTLIPQIVAVAITLMTEILGAIQTVGPQITATFVVIITSLLNAITTLTPRIISTMLTLIQALLNAIVSSVGMFVTAALQLITGILNGIAQGIPGVVEAGANLIIAFVTSIGAQAARVADAAFDTVITFINSLTSTVNARMGELRTAGKELAFAMIDGMTGGLASKAGAVIDKISGIAGSAIDKAKGLLGINSPSKVFQEIGEWTGEGMAIGIDSMGRVVTASAEGVAVSAVDGMRDGLSGMDDLVGAEFDTDPVIRPVLDLSDIRRDASSISDILDNVRIDIGKEAYSQASGISLSRNRDNHSEQEAEKTQVINNVEYNQYNTSPKSLSESEIYRRTRNQISTVEEALNQNAH